jgi:hypothetical protein
MYHSRPAKFTTFLSLNDAGSIFKKKISFIQSEATISSVDQCFDFLDQHLNEEILYVHHTVGAETMDPNRPGSRLSDDYRIYLKFNQVISTLTIGVLENKDFVFQALNHNIKTHFFSRFQKTTQEYPHHLWKGLLFALKPEPEQAREHFRLILNQLFQHQFSDKRVSSRFIKSLCNSITDDTYGPEEVLRILSTDDASNSPHYHEVFISLLTNPRNDFIPDETWHFNINSLAQRALDLPGDEFRRLSVSFFVNAHHDRLNILQNFEPTEPLFQLFIQFLKTPDLENDIGDMEHVDITQNTLSQLVLKKQHPQPKSHKRIAL